jgi:signal transduction histidine kinase
MVLLLATGAALVVAALASWGRPGRGAVLALASILWFVAEWDSPATGSSLVFTTGLLVGDALPVVVASVVLADPVSSRGRADRALLGATAVAGPVLLGVGAAMFGDPAANGCLSCADNLVVLRDDPALAADLTQLGLASTAVVLVAVVVRSMWRLLSSGRQDTLDVAFSGDVFLLLTAVSAAWSVDDGFVGTGTIQHRLWVGQALALCVLAASVVGTRVRHVRQVRALVRVVADLGGSSAPRNVGAALADAVGDPTLEVAYPVDDERFADRDGRVVVPLPPPPGRDATRLVAADRVLAVVTHSPGALHHRPLDELIAAVGLLLENEGLQARLHVQAADLRASRERIVRATDAARRRLERDLHDGAQQRLVAVRLTTGVIEHRIRPDCDTAAHLGDATAQLDRAIERLRELATWIHPPVLSERGLAAAVLALAERSSEPVTVGAMIEVRLADAVESTAYQLVAEAARAGPTYVSTRLDDDTLVIDVESTAVPTAITELEDRVGALDGHLAVLQDGRPSVRILAEVPCGS